MDMLEGKSRFTAYSLFGALLAMAAILVLRPNVPLWGPAALFVAVHGILFVIWIFAMIYAPVKTQRH